MFRPTPRPTNNLVKPSMSLPLPLYYGTISVDKRKEEYPSGTITYTSCHLQVGRGTTVDQIFSVYTRESKVRIEDLYFKVSRVNSRLTDLADTGAVGQLRTYDVSIELEWQWEREAEEPIEVYKHIRPQDEGIRISKLCSVQNIPFSGTDYEIKADPEDKEFTISVASAVSDYARVLGCYVEYGNGIAMRKMTAQKQWSFNQIDYIEDGRVSDYAFPYYEDTVLTWDVDDKQDEDKRDDDELNGNAAPKYDIKEPEVVEIEEFDFNFKEPPANILQIKDMSLNARQSGPTKQYKKTTTVDGTPEKTEIQIWGFEYTGKDVEEGTTGVIRSTNPKNFWRQVEKQTWQAKYKALGDQRVLAFATDPSTDKEVPLVPHPDYSDFFTEGIGGSDQVELSVKTEVLLENSLTGWKRMAFLNEDAGQTIELDPNDTIEAKEIAAYTPRRIPLKGVQKYKIVGSRNQRDIGQPFSVQWFDYDDLPNNVKLSVSRFEEVTEEGRVGVLYPDPNYAPPIFAKEELTYNSSFAWMEHPSFDEANPVVDEIFLITGEESYTTIKREYLAEKSNTYQESTFQFSSQGAGFSELVSEPTVIQRTGSFPQATTRQSRWEESEKKPDSPISTDSGEDEKERILISTTINKPKLHRRIASVNSIGAGTKKKAILYAETDLKMQIIDAGSHSVTIFSYLPRIKPMERFRGQYVGTHIITGVSYTIEFDQDKFNEYNLLQGIALELGPDFNNPSLDYKNDRQEAEEKPNQDSSSGDPELTFEPTNFRPIEFFGDITLPVSNRGRF